MSDDKIAEDEGWRNDSPDADEFLKAAERLIFGSLPESERPAPGATASVFGTEAQWMGMRLARFLAAVFRARMDAESERWLRKCCAEFMAEPNLTVRRERAVLEVAYWGEKLRVHGLNEHDLGILQWNLAAADPAFAAAFEGDVGLELLKKRMAPFEAQARFKGHSAERIVAEMIVLDTDNGALGYAGDGDDDEESIQTIRRALATMTAKQRKK